MKIFIKHIISVLTLVFSLVSCVDETFYTDGSIPEGETELDVKVSFHDFTPALQTRAAGNSIKNIESLWLVIYEKDDTDAWTLEEGGKIRITAEEHRLTTSTVGNSRPDGEAQAETQSGHADFRLRHKNGVYKIYAVANHDLSEVKDTDIDTPEKLKGLNLFWDEENVRNTAEMFGCFTNDKSEPMSDDETVTVSPNRPLHAWLRRAASKVTVAYDGTNLKDGVSIYIMAASIKDIPRSCPLGMPNTPTHTDFLIHDGGIIKYFEGDVQPNENGFLDNYKAVISNKTPTYGSDHSETADALFFYENMQGEGEDKRQKDEDKDGKPDNADRLKDDKPYGTYIEVDAVYRSENPTRPGTGIIKYRFMLGKSITTDYNAERNHHYKLTLKFNNFANDYDWHIEYLQDVFEVTEPKIFDYMGKVFVPDYTLPNRGHNFSRDNVVTVTSVNGAGQWAGANVSFRDLTKGETQFSSSCDWLSVSDMPGDLPYERKFNIRVLDSKLVPDENIDIDANLRAQPEKGSMGVPWNLAHSKGTSDQIECTANCYIIDAPGWYILPLVYGNAIHNGVTNIHSYEYYGDLSGEHILKKFVNHLGNPITDPYIRLNPGCENPSKAAVVWQDVNPGDYGSIVRPRYEWEKTATWDISADVAKSPTYISSAYGGKGGIRFYVNPANIQQGNAVISIQDANGLVMWSWHLWFTRFDYEEQDKTIEVTGHDAVHKFNLMPVNLGWCSKPGEKIKYFKERRCEVRFTSAFGQTQTITIVKKSHIATTRGDNPYYQWGRKDPFIPGADANGSQKIWYDYRGWSGWLVHPDHVMTPGVDEGNRLTTRTALARRIQEPLTWHNPPSKEGTEGRDADCDDKSYDNLWQGRPGDDPYGTILKTVYDPCPVGYQVPHYIAFSGFTTTGKNTSWRPEWYDVRLENIDGYDSSTESCGVYSDALFEFYTNPEKYQSVIFPINGYRDWNSMAGLLSFGKGYVWSAGNIRFNDNIAYYMEFSREADGGFIRNRDTFYTCDGMPIRPVKNGNHGINTP